MSGREGQEEGLLQGSLKALQKAVTLSPGNARYWSSFGVIATTMGPSHYGLAQHAFIKSLQLNEHVRSVLCVRLSVEMECVCARNFLPCPPILTRTL